MTTFSFYDPATGIFVGRSFSGPQRMLEANTPEGLSAMVGQFDPAAHRVDIETGEVVPYTPPGPTLDELKAARWEEIKLARTGAEYGGFTVPSIGTFQSDPDSQRLITGSVVVAQLAAAQGAPFSVTWTLADNSTAELGAQGMIAVGLALAAHVEACHVAGRTARAALEAATTPEEVAAVSFSLP